MLFFSMVVCAFVSSTLVNAYTYPDACPRIQPVDFDRTKLSGTWYEFTHSKGAGYSCGIYDQQFVPTPDEPHQLALINAQTRFDNGSVIDEKEYIRIPPTLEGTYPKHAPDGREIFTFYILDTDYTSYMIGYFCGFQDYIKIGQEIFFAARDKKYPAGHMEKMLAVLEKNGITHSIESRPEGCEGLKLPDAST